MEPESDGSAINGPKSPDQAKSPPKKSFAETVSPPANGVNPNARFSKAPGKERSSEEGKCPSTILGSFCILPNLEMLNEIASEKTRLSNTAIFFACVDVEKCPPRKFLDNWFHNLWNLKLGLKISFCRQIQKGFYLIFFNSHEAQRETLKRQYWTVGNTSFRALALSLEVVSDEVLALSSPRWVILKDVPPFLWHFLPQLMEPFGKMIRIDKTTRLVPNLDARMLVSIKPGIDIPPSLTVNVNEETFVFPIEMLGGLNACFLCKKEGHLQKNCPIINRRNHKPNFNSTDSSTNPRTKIFQHSSTPLPVNEEAAIPITNSSELKPMHIDHMPLVSDQLGPASNPTIGPLESPSDCFQLVTSRKRRRKINNLNAPNQNHPNIPTINQGTGICDYPLPTNNSSPAPLEPQRTLL